MRGCDSNQEGLLSHVSPKARVPAQLPVDLAHLASPTSAQEGLYRLTVELPAQHVVAYGETAPLRSGMTLDAAVIQDRRRVIEWVFEPLLGAAQRRA